MLCQWLRCLVLIPAALSLSALTIAVLAEGRQCRRAVHVAFKILIWSFFASAVVIGTVSWFAQCPVSPECTYQTVRNADGLCASPPSRPLFGK